MAYLKPQSPIKNGEDRIYPLTTYDQIIMADGSRWNGSTENSIGFLQYDASWDSAQNAFAIPISAFTNPASTTDASYLAFNVYAPYNMVIFADSFVSGSTLYIRGSSLSGDNWGRGATLNIMYLTNSWANL